MQRRASFARAARRAAAARRRHRGGRHRRAGLPQHHRRRRRPGRGRRRRRRGRGGVRPQRRRSPATRINVEFISRQPDRAAAPRPHPVGRRRRRARPGARRGRRRGRPGSSTSTTAATRWTSSAPRSRPRRRASRCRRTATTARTSTTSPQQVRRRGAGHPRPARRRAAGRVPRGRLRSSSSRSSRSSSTTFRTHFDVWFSERVAARRRRGRPTSLEKLRGQGHLFDADGALWMRTTDFGDDKDRVLIRSNGELTYFASDTAYYVDKRGARLRRVHLPARRRPPRLRRPAAGDGRLRRRRPGRATSRC